MNWNKKINKRFFDANIDETTFEWDETTIEIKREGEEVTVTEEYEDNIGQDVCRWCGRPTVDKPLLSTTYKYCEICKK